jgi:hypothetical protein
MSASRIEQLMTVQKEAKELFEKKNADYGDAFATSGTVGVLVRIGDKIQRLQSISNRGIQLVDDEKLRDTLIDLHNYAAMGIMLLDEADNTPILESNNPTSIKRWNISGSQGYCYERQVFVNSDNKKIDTCSCPSFKYCKQVVKICKHIGEEVD